MCACMRACLFLCVYFGVVEGPESRQGRQEGEEAKAPSFKECVSMFVCVCVAQGFGADR